jgi:hypothetical protein
VIEEDEVEPTGTEAAQCGAGSRGPLDREALIAQTLRNEASDPRIIFDEKQVCRLAQDGVRRPGLGNRAR